MSLETRRAPVGTALVKENRSGQAAASSTPILPAHGDARGSDPQHVVATAYIVTGTRGRQRLVLLVACDRCGSCHTHTAKPWFRTGWRKPACHLGPRYLVHVAAVEGGCGQ